MLRHDHLKKFPAEYAAGVVQARDAWRGADLKQQTMNAMDACIRAQLPTADADEAVAERLGFKRTWRSLQVENHIKAKPQNEGLSPLQAAHKFAGYLRRQGYQPSVWDAAKVKETGWTQADACVCLEGGPDLSLMQLYERGPFKGCDMQPWPGVFVEPYSTWLMTFRKDGDA